ncbi:hypothetical protein [Knoellia subterranea]|uniref:hypothetical protein n=1 Tax=Knoellia subterranea TaxID=184882 RepID=UPI0012EC9410|nr:hypothetical protein [Knoellia subterranea]
MPGLDDHFNLGCGTGPRLAHRLRASCVSGGQSVTPIPNQVVDELAGLVPVCDVDDVVKFEPSPLPGATRYKCELASALPLEALLLNAQSDTLVVSFHGALNRETYELPRFERLKSLRETGFSSLYFADPGFHQDPRLQPTWFAGTVDVDLYPLLADWTISAARSIGARRVIFSGSCGGGFAALQVSALVPQSFALAFNPQTAISKYLDGGSSYGAQRGFVDLAMPSLAPNGFGSLESDVDWAAPLGDRLTVLQRYSVPRGNQPDGVLRCAEKDN